MSNIYLTEQNIHTFIEKLVEAIKQGYRVVHSNEGSVSTAFLYEIKLFKDVDVTSIELSDYKVTLSEHDAMRFLLAVQNAVLNGYEVNLDSLRWDSTGVKMINVFDPKHPHSRKYSYQELEEYEWETLKELAKTFDITGRNRVTMINAILNAQEKNHE